MSKISCVKICKKCGKEFTASSGYVKYCDDCAKETKKETIRRHKDKVFLKKQEDFLNGVENVDYVIDRWNGLATRTIGSKWMQIHHPDKTLGDYKKEFPDAPLVCEKTSKIISDNSKLFMNTPEIKKLYSDRIKGDKNPNAKCNTTEEQRKSVSPFSKSFKGYEGMSDEEKEKNISNCLKLDKIGRTTSQIEYWINKGYTETEAKEKVSERQRTFTLEKCIEKYGPEEGYKKWKDRQEKWSEKIEGKYKQGLFSKAPHSTTTSIFSQTEKEFVDEIIQIGHLDMMSVHCYKTSQTELINEKLNRCENKRFLYDFSYKNKIIEFNGDFWHMNPEKYDGTYYNKISKIYAKDKWEIDNIKIDCAKEYGYDILIIWESDYNKDKEGTIQKCIDFLTK